MWQKFSNGYRDFRRIIMTYGTSPFPYVPEDYCEFCWPVRVHMRAIEIRLQPFYEVGFWSLTADPELRQPAPHGLRMVTLPEQVL